MRKEEADVLKQEFGTGTSHADALEFMSSEVLEESTQVLDFLEKYLGTAISDFSLDESHDLLDVDQGDLVRTLWFSRGMEDTFICVTPDGGIKAMDPEIPMKFLANVATALDELTEE